MENVPLDPSILIEPAEGDYVRLISIPTLAATLAAAACQSLPSVDVSQTEVAAATQRWANAFNDCDSQRAAALYDGTAVLWGTVSPTIISSATGVAQYFERACASRPQPKVVFGEQKIRIYGDTAVNSGTYTFTVFPAGQARELPARYSFTYRKLGGQWLIVDHHSSLMPTPPAQPARP